MSTWSQVSSARISLIWAIMRILRTFLVVASLSVLLVGASSSATNSPPAAAMTVSSSAVAGTSHRATDAGNAVNDTRRANKLLDDLRARYRYLDGVTVTLGTTPHGEQAVAYYTEGRIVISRTHTVSIEKILAHEIWHVIDWRDNGRIDWHESLPPSNSSDYLRK
ncbi:MAG TPA: hypothetical protein VIL41_06595 [Coriobacteriia bacterium]